MPTGSSLLAALRAALPDDAVVVDPDRLASYRTDQATGVPAGDPAVVVFPRTTEQVSAVLAAAFELRVAVVPRGAGSGLSGGANAVDGCVVLCLEKMDRILSVNAGDGYVEVEPGVVNQELREHVRGHGLWYAPDPASKDWCTIGGNVSTNAGGLCCVKYGVTRDSVLGLEVVLADGRVAQLGRRTVKGVSGYDLTGLVVGSEGTLAVVTRARLRLRPLPPQPTTLVAVFPGVAEAGVAVQSILAEVTPSLLELMDRTTVRAVEAFAPMGLDTEAGALLLAQSDAPGTGGALDTARMAFACERAGAIEVYQSEDPEQADLLLGARRMAIPALEQLGAWLLDDVAVPRSRLADAVVGIERIAEARSVVIGTFGHAGDGNLHPTIVYPHGDDDSEQRAFAAFDDVLALALQLGGTVTGEHGVGLLKRDRLRDELDPVSRSLHSAVKQALDPRGILNPGKALPPL